MSSMHEHLTHPVFDIISECASEMNVEAYVVGGWVRDILLQRPCKDIDVVAIARPDEHPFGRGSGIELAERVAKKLGSQFNVTIFKTFGTAQIKYEDYDIEFVGARKESYNHDS